MPSPLRIVFSDRPARAFGPAILVDRDGVINHKVIDGYVLDWPQFVFISGIRPALKELSSLRLPLIVISNQAAVGKGLLTEDGLREITLRMQQALLADGIAITACYYCIHRPDEGCDCRKPRDGMIRQAAADFNIDLARSVFIGDSLTDVEAARSADCNPVLFGLKSCHSFANGVSNEQFATTAEELIAMAKKCLGKASTS